MERAVNGIKKATSTDSVIKAHVLFQAARRVFFE
jgi:hypothetical protein